MSLGKMLTKMAIGFAVAKGMQKVSQSGGIGSVLEGLSGASGQQQAGSSGGLGDIMGKLGGGKQGGGLADVLGGLTGGKQGGGGLMDILGGLTGGKQAGAGGLGGIGGLLGGLAQARGGQAEQGSSLEDILRQDNPIEEPDEDQTAGLMIRAMIMAARSDGEIDAAEQEQLMSTLGEDASQEDMEFVRAAMQAPVDAQAISSDVPKGLETQVYSMSVMSITPDNAKEANYLHQLAQSMSIEPQTVNEIHDNFGVPRLYS